MIRNLVENLLTLTDDDWSVYSFYKDALNLKLTKSDKTVLYKKAVECGFQLASNLRCKYGTASPEELSKLLGANLFIKEQVLDSVYGLFACYEEPDIITVFLNFAEAADELLAKYNLYEFTGEINTADLLIAHELYHYLEHITPGIYTAQKHITLWRLGPFESRSRILSLEEIGAMSFAKELTGIKCSPYLFDVIILYTQSPHRAQKLYEFLMNLKAR